MKIEIQKLFVVLMAFTSFLTGCQKSDELENKRQIVENLVIGNSQFIEGSIPLPEGVEFDELEGPSKVLITNKTGANALSFFADEPISLLLVEFEGIDGYFQIVYKKDGDFAFARLGEEKAVHERIANMALDIEKNGLPKFVDIKVKIIGVVGYEPGNQPPTREILQGFFNERTFRILRYIGLWRFQPIIFECGVSTVRDFEGNVYKTVKIGSQCWMKENLVVSKYQNGLEIPIGNGNRDGGDIFTTSAYVPILDRAGRPLRTRGFYYNFFAATDSKGICPLGWRIPSKIEYETLIAELGGTEVAGDKLKSNVSGDFSWYPTPLSARNSYNSSGFSALYTNGFGIDDGTVPGTAFWSNSTDGCPVHEANILYLTNTESSAELVPLLQYSYVSCRCIKE